MRPALRLKPERRRDKSVKEAALRLPDLSLCPHFGYDRQIRTAGAARKNSRQSGAPARSDPAPILLEGAGGVEEFNE